MQASLACSAFVVCFRQQSAVRLHNCPLPSTYLTAWKPRTLMQHEPTVVYHPVQPLSESADHAAAQTQAPTHHALQSNACVHGMHMIPTHVKITVPFASLADATANQWRLH